MNVFKQIIMNRKNMVRIIFWVLFAFLLTSCETEEQEKQSIDVTKILVRVAEIEVYPQYFDQYCTILKEESRVSMEKEIGVISIFPLFEKKRDNSSWGEKEKEEETHVINREDKSQNLRKLT